MNVPLTHELFFFDFLKVDKELHSTKSPPKGWSYRFIVVTDERRWYFAASSSAEREAWYFSILNCCGRDESGGNSGGGGSGGGGSIRTNPHAYFVTKFVREFASMLVDPYPMQNVSSSTSSTSSQKRHSDKLLQHTVKTMITLSDRVTIDLEISCPWLLEDSDDGFQADVMALETPLLPLSSSSSSSDTTALLDNRRRKEAERKRYRLKVQVRAAVTNALLGRVGLRLWAAVRRDWITMDQHLEKCFVAMKSINDEVLWELCSRDGGGGEGGEKEEEDEEPWPYFVNGWRDAVRCMDAVELPTMPLSKMEALAEVRLFFLFMFFYFFIFNFFF